MELAELVAHHHDRLLAMIVERAQRDTDTEGLTRVELLDALPFFLDSLVESLAALRERPDTEAAGADHGSERLKIGFHVDEVVREYFIVSACILETADSEGVQPTAAELRTLMRAVGDAAAAAASEYMRRREAELVKREVTHAGFLAHEVRSSLAGARFAFDLLRRRELTGASELARVVDDSLRRATQHVDHALQGQRLQSVGVQRSPVLLRVLLDELVSELRPQIDEKRLGVTIACEPTLTIEADPRLLRSAIGNLVANAVKFTLPRGHIALRAQGDDDSVTIEVEDSCSGLPPGAAEKLFEPFVQAGADRSGVGLGLTIARTAVEAHGGALNVRDLPGEGCVFVLELPRQPPSSGNGAGEAP